MAFVKYVLAQTGLFPRCEPDVDDVFKAAKAVHEIKRLYNEHGVLLWYVFPRKFDKLHIRELKRLFSDNGVLLRVHYSHRYNERVLAVRDRGQRFVYDVKKVYENNDYFEKVKEYRETEVAERRKKVDRIQKIFAKPR